MYTHVTEASALDQVRRPLYAAITEGKSKEISDRLIAFADVSVAAAAVIDLWAATYQTAGISVICDDLMPISNTPGFVEKSSFDPAPLSDFKPLKIHEIEKQFRAAYKNGSYAALVERTRQHVEGLQRNPSYHCMVKHILSSILRAANLAPRQIQEAQQAGFAVSPSGLIWSFIDVQLLSLGSVEAIDELSAPLQARGVPIVCQDLPEIPES